MLELYCTRQTGGGHVDVPKQWDDKLSHRSLLYEREYGTAVGNIGTILHTTDGGATWTSQNSGTTNRLNGVFFVDGCTGTAVGDTGMILRTNTGGTRP
jgi:photosystem II stability/assembly factor-like uncharacterized protein